MAKSEPSKQDLKWIKEQEVILDEGRELVRAASDEALSYMTDAMENMGDRAWRKMAVSTQAIEIGVGKTIADVIIPQVYNDMRKRLHKKANMPVNVSHALIDIYIGRLIKNIRRALDERDR